MALVALLDADVLVNAAVRDTIRQPDDRSRPLLSPEPAGQTRPSGDGLPRPPTTCCGISFP